MDRYEDFTDAKDGLVALSREIVRARQRWEHARISLGAARKIMADLNQSHPTGYKELLALINAEAAAHPDDPAWQDLKRERDKIVADGTATLSAMTAKLTALDNA